MARLFDKERQAQMTAEEIERVIEFLIESQAKHDAQIGELRDQVAGLAERGWVIF
jgi:tRNA(Ser,Leu) C12 N-acetylase TAN1